MECQHPASAWRTRATAQGAVEERACSTCGRVLARTRLELPLDPYEAGSCAWCGGPRGIPGRLEVCVLEPGAPLDAGPPCSRCGRTRGRDLREHVALLRWVERRTGPLGRSFLHGAERAREMGRGALALKLATAAVAYQGNREAARALRIELLAGLGRPGPAEAEARAWHGERDAPPFVTSLLTTLLFRRGANAEALAVLDQALERHPGDVVLRVERAELLEEFGHWEAACADAAIGLEGMGELRETSLGVLVRCAERLLALGRHQAVIERVDAGGRVAHMTPELAWLRSCALLELGRDTEARRWLVHTLDLAPDHAEARLQLEAIEERLGIARLAHLYRAS